MEQEDIDTGVLQLKSWFRAWSSYMPTAPLFEAEARLLVKSIREQATQLTDAKRGKKK